MTKRQLIPVTRDTPTAAASRDPRIVDIMRVVEKLTDEHYYDPAGIYWILEALAEALDGIGREREGPEVYALMGALCSAAPSRLLDVMHAEALEQERMNASLDGSPYKAVAS